MSRTVERHNTGEQAGRFGPSCNGPHSLWCKRLGSKGAARGEIVKVLVNTDAGEWNRVPMGGGFHRRLLALSGLSHCHFLGARLS
jgi:hypothetical protein